MNRNPANPETSPTPADRPFVSYAQNFEDVLLNRVFSGLDEGFYVDIGAFDPVRGSVTKLFYDRGWSGINVEPGSVFERLAAERTRDINLNIAVLDRSGEVNFVEVDDDAATSFVDDAAKPSAPALVGESRVVKCDTLDHIIEEYGADRLINFLKIDAEGSEAPIINSVDWRRVRPQVILVEATMSWTTQLNSDSWESSLLSNGYTRAYFDGLNLFFVRDEDADLLKHFAIPVNILDAFERYDPDKIQIRERLEAVWNENFELTQVRDRLFNERAAAIEQADQVNRELNERLDELGKQNAELVSSRHQLINESAAATEQADQVNRELNERLDELEKRNAELISHRDRLLAEAAETLEKSRQTNQGLVKQIAALATENIHLVQARDLLLAERDQCRDEMTEMEQAKLALQSSLLELRQANAELQEQCNLVSHQLSLVRRDSNSKIEDLERRLSDPSCAAEEVRRDALRYHRLVQSLDAPDGPRAIRAVLPIARLIRAGHHATMGRRNLTVMATSESPVQMQSHRSAEKLPTASWKTTVKSILRPLVRFVYPVARPLAFRTRRYLLHPLDQHLSEVEARTETLVHQLATQSSKIEAQSQLLDALLQHTQLLSQQMGSVHNPLSTLAESEARIHAEISRCTQQLTQLSHDSPPELLKSIDCLILSLAAHAGREGFDRDPRP